MNKPISAGDRAVVVNSLSRGKSPNIGLIVDVGVRVYGNHGMDSAYGPVHRCTGKGLTQFAENGDYVVMNWAHIPVSWLQKIEPDEPVNVKARDTETTE